MSFVYKLKLASKVKGEKALDLGEFTANFPVEKGHLICLRKTYPDCDIETTEVWYKVSNLEHNIQMSVFMIKRSPGVSYHNCTIYVTECD